jgi:hypothetical protein
VENRANKGGVNGVNGEDYRDGQGVSGNEDMTRGSIRYTRAGALWRQIARFRAQRSARAPPLQQSALVAVMLRVQRSTFDDASNISVHLRKPNLRSPAL